MTRKAIIQLIKDIIRFESYSTELQALLGPKKKDWVKVEMPKEYVEMIAILSRCGFESSKESGTLFAELP